MLSQKCSKEQVKKQKVKVEREMVECINIAARMLRQNSQYVALNSASQ